MDYDILQNIVVALAIILAAIYVVRATWRLHKKGGSDCASGCSGCPLSSKCEQKEDGSHYTHK